jgi:hypothetical protein
MHAAPTYSGSSQCNWNTLSVFQQMQSNTDNFVNRQVEMQEMKKLYQFQLDQYKLTMSFMGLNQ